MESVLMTSEERKRVESFRTEHKTNWEREQYLLEVAADRRGESFTPGTYQEVSDADALAAVRAGWKSGLEKAFEKKFKREAVRGIIPGGLLFKK